MQIRQFLLTWRSSINNRAKKHHVLSQFYLKGFTNGRRPKSQLLVIDIARGTHYQSKPQAVGFVTDFNTITIDGKPSDIIEKQLSKFEGSVSSSLKELEETLCFEGDVQNDILNFLALLQVRSPRNREYWRKQEQRTSEILIDATLSSKAMYESQMRKAKEADPTLPDQPSYEDAKASRENGEYIFELSNEYHIKREMELVKGVVPYLSKRQWTLYVNDFPSHFFITSDNPVYHEFDEPENMPRLLRTPGHAHANTSIYFPLSQRLALHGRFDGDGGVVKADRRCVAELNNTTLLNGPHAIYAPKLTFEFMGKQDTILTGEEIIKEMEKLQS